MARHPVVLGLAVLTAVLMGVAELAILAVSLAFLGTIIGGGALAEQTSLGPLITFFEGFPVIEQIRLIALMFVGIALVKGALAYTSARLGQVMHLLVERDLRSDVFDQCLEVEFSFVQREKVGNLYTVLHNYPTNAAKIVDEVMEMLPKVATFVAVLFAALQTSWELTLIFLVLAALATRAVGGLVKRVRAIAGGINEARVRVNQQSLESLTSMKVIRLFAREKHAGKRFRDELGALQSQQYRKARFESLVSPVYFFLNMCLIGIVLVSATFILARSDGEWVTLLVAFLYVTQKLMSPAANYAKKRTRIVAHLPAAEQLILFLDRSDKPYLPEGRETFPGLREKLHFDGVRFRYGDKEPWVVEGLDLTIPKGATVALVGGSGAGKTTIASMVARLYDPVEGAVRVDGRDLREFTSASWRQRLAVVSQDNILFNTSALENIRFGRLDASDDEVYEAARQANAHDFLHSLPEGYQTVVGDRGVRLSGGQAQRIAIARAILADPDLLILDEATSALDTETERLVQDALERATRNRTVIVIAHRLSTVRKADLIVVLEQGRVVEQGTHDELLEKEGRYAHYIGLQGLAPDEAPTPEQPARRVPVQTEEPREKVLVKLAPAPVHAAAPEPRQEPEQVQADPVAPPVEPAVEPEAVEAPSVPEKPSRHEEFRRKADALFKR